MGLTGISELIADSVDSPIESNKLIVSAWGCSSYLPFLYVCSGRRIRPIALANAFSEFLLNNLSSSSKSKSFRAATLQIQAVSCSEICDKQWKLQL